RTQWTKYHLDTTGTALRTEPVAGKGSIEYSSLGDGVTFVAPAFTRDTEITGPIAARLFISSTTKDADLFLVVTLFNPRGDEVTFQGALDPNTPIAQGWLRASHRELDLQKSLPYRPYHTHTKLQPLTPGDIYEVEVEIWPTCIVAPSGYRLALIVRGND